MAKQHATQQPAGDLVQRVPLLLLAASLQTSEALHAVRAACDAFGSLYLDVWNNAE